MLTDFFLFQTTIKKFERNGKQGKKVFILTGTIAISLFLASLFLPVSLQEPHLSWNSSIHKHCHLTPNRHAMGLLTAERMAVLVAGDPILAIRAAAAAADPLVMPEHARASAPLAGTVATLTPEDRALVQWAHDPASQPLFAAMEGRRADYARLTAPPPWAPSRGLQQLSSPGRRWWWLGSDLTPRGKGAEWIPLLNTRHKLSAVGPLIPWGGGWLNPSFSPLPSFPGGSFGSNFPSVPK